jgi:hypothetical protein
VRLAPVVVGRAAHGLAVDRDHRPQLPDRYAG